MLFISDLKKNSDMFCKSEALEVLYDYMDSAINGKIKERIIALKHEGDRIEVRHDLGYGMFAIEQSYVMNDSYTFESHKKYIDFQLIVANSEYMEVGSKECFSVKLGYDDNRDVILYNKVLEVSKIALYAGNILVLFDDDIHAGGIKFSDECVFKSVIKVPYSLLKFRF